MRFDDSLRTVLAADVSSAFGAQSAFRQLVDLIGRRRVVGAGEPLDRLGTLRAQVPDAVRAASARSLALADPPAALVAFFADDQPAVAAPVLRAARLSDEEWTALLPRLGPTGRAVLRGRQDLSPKVGRALAAFGATDFTIGHDGPTTPTPPAVTPAAPAPAEPRAPAQTFAIAELVQRIETFHRVRERDGSPTIARVERFALETDPRGVIRWVEGAPRAALVGRKLEIAPRQRSVAARLAIEAGDLAGDWTVSAVPMFAPETGRFAGVRGVARRAASNDPEPIEPEALRRLVHELRTPTNAIVGFAELIETQLLGPVAPDYRARAGAIGRDVRALIGAIDDLEISARVDGGALDLAPRAVDLAAALAAAIESAEVAGRIRLEAEPGLTVIADDRALARLLVRLAATVGAPPSTEPVTVAASAGATEVVVRWPWSPEHHDTSLLGAEFALRLAHKLAGALGGRLVTEPTRLTLHLPASFNAQVQATTH